MTVSYSRLVANGSSFGCFWSILFKWKGSVYKLIWRELLVYLLFYFSISLTYRYVLNASQQRTFELMKEYFDKNSENIPMVFVMGFYVTLVVKRWWEQYRLLPWPDTLALFVSAAIPGVDERGRLMRRNIVRYAILAYVITLKHVSVRVKKRFPTLQHLVDAGLLMESEKKIFELMDQRHPMAKYWLPLTWATNIINRARKETLILSDHMVQTLLTEMSDIRMRLGSLIGYDNVTVPLAYTQVVTLSVYVYFLSALMGRQFITHTNPGKGDVDMYFPFFTVLQFCFYIGWLKVAEVLIGPFGEDDDDIELNWLIDRHIKAAYMIVDEMHEEHPELLKDQYWDEVVPKDLPYTVASEHYRRHEPKGSAEFYKVKQNEAIYANLTHRKSIANTNNHPDDVYADYESVDTPLVERRKNWFQRQMQRMGSIRSSSTTYSSGLFGRTRHSSVYSNPEVLPTTTPPLESGPAHPLPHKMSIYDRLIGRKSTRRGKPPGKLNMANIPANLKNRPRIPTPDVTKEGGEKDNRILAFQNNNNLNNNNNNNNSINNGQFPLANGGVQTSNSLAEVPIVHVVLSPIQEIEGHQSSVTSTGSGELRRTAVARVVPAEVVPVVPGVAGVAGIAGVAGVPVVPVSVAEATAALAQAVLSPTLSSAGIMGPVAVAVSPLPHRTPPQVKICEMTDAQSDSACGSSTASTASVDDRSRKASVTSQSKRSEVYV